MFFKSTHLEVKISVKQAIFKSQTEDGGLFVPEFFPKVDLSKIAGKDFPSVAFEVLGSFFRISQAKILRV